MSGHSTEGMGSKSSIVQTLLPIAQTYERLFAKRQMILETAQEAIAVMWNDYNLMHLCGLDYQPPRAVFRNPRYRHCGPASIFYDKLLHGQLHAADVEYTHNRGITLDKLSIIDSMLATPDPNDCYMLVNSSMHQCQYAFGTGTWCVGIGCGHGPNGGSEPFDPDVPMVLMPVTLRKGPITGRAAMQTGTCPRRITDFRIIPHR